MNVSRRRPILPILFVGFLAAVGAAGLGVLLSGAAFASATSSSKGPLVIDTSFVLQSLDPEKYNDPTALIAEKAIYDNLLTQSAKGPVLSSTTVANSFKESSDARKFTFRLRKNVRFADGRPLTSADVVFSFRRVANLKVGNSGLLAGSTFSAPSRYVVVIKSAVPNPAIPEALTMPAFGIVNSKLLKANGGTDAANASTADHSAKFFNTQSAGSGPYVLSSLKANSQVVLKTNPRYWGPRSHFETVVIRNMLAPEQLLNVQRGTNEIALDLSSQQAATLKGKPHMEVHISPSPSVFYLALNADPKVSAVTSNPKVQQAIRYALNYDAMLQIAGPGSVRAAGLMAQGFLGARPVSAAYRTNLTKAKALMSAAGISNPSIDLSYPSGLTVNGVEFSTLSQRVEADLGQIGISVSIHALPVNPFLTAYLAGKLAMSQVYWYPDYPDPNQMLYYIPGGNYSHRIKWEKGASPGVENLAKKAASTVNTTMRIKLWQKVQADLQSNSPWIPEFQTAQAVVGSANLTNLKLNSVWTINVAPIGSK